MSELRRDTVRHALHRTSLSCSDKAVKSLHAVFPREGRADEPVSYEVIRHHDGRSFATRSITATQSKGPIGTASVSMHVAEDGPAVQAGDPVGPVPGPEHEIPLDLIPWETRAADDLNATATGPPSTTHTIWFHRPFTTDQWLLLRQHSPLLAHDRRFGRGDMLTHDGVLVASYAQEALLRLPN